MSGRIINAAEAKMEADAPLGQKRPKYDEAVLHNLERDRQSLLNSNMSYLQLCETAGRKNIIFF